MSLFSSVKNYIPTLRFDGFRAMGAHVKPADTRTTEQLLENIEYYAQRNPEVAMFKEELKSMNPKHLGLVSDICEIANGGEFRGFGIDIKKPVSNGKSLFAFLMEKLPKASKENPKALDFAQEVINNTDNTTSKYFLTEFTGVIDRPELGRHFEALKPMVKDIAQQTLNGSHTMDFEKQKNFMDFIKVMINPESKPEKISMLQKLVKAADEIPGNNELYIDDFVRSNAPVSRVEENLKTVPLVAEMFAKDGKSIDIVDFVNNNINLY